MTEKRAMVWELDLVSFVVGDVAVVLVQEAKNRTNLPFLQKSFDWLHRLQPRVVNEMLDCAYKLTRGAVVYMLKMWYYTKTLKRDPSRDWIDLLLCLFRLR